MEKKVSQSTISWEAANAIVAGAVRKAEEMGLRVSATVLDKGGHMAAFLRMPGAPFHTIQIASNKAYTAVSFGFPTSQWGAIAETFSPMVKQGLPMADRIAMFGGGLPIEVDGEVIGSIGVSGASEDEDSVCAQAGIDSIS